MFPRSRLANRLTAGAIALILAGSAGAAAQVSSTPLAQVDAWGVGWISANEGALPAGFWDNTTADTLAPILAAIQPKDLAPSARTALRRILLSRSKGPAGGDKLIGERLRLMDLLGEATHAADLRKRYPAAEWAKGGDRLAAELDLLQDRDAAACAAAAARPAADPDWLPIRAICAAEAGDLDAANLAAEQVARTNESLGVWLIAALPAIGSDIAKPDGRFGTPLEAAVSVSAKLPVPANAFAGATPDVAAAIALDANATPEQRRAALRPALASGGLKAADVLAILSLKPTEVAPKPATRGAAPKPDYLAQALAVSADKEATAEAKAAAYALALRSAETHVDGRLASMALAAAIKALPRNDATLPYAEPLTRAALVASDEKLAADWRKHLGTQAKDQLDAWAAARIDLMLSFAGATNEKPSVILDRMLAAAPYPETGATPAAKAPSAGEQQLAVRRIENTRALFLHVGMSRDLTAAQRAMLAGQRTAGRGVSDAAISRITAAARQNANAEAALAIIAQLGPDVSALSFAGLADLLAQLRETGMTDDADAIALEALQVWKAL